MGVEDSLRKISESQKCTICASLRTGNLLVWPIRKKNTKFFLEESNFVFQKMFPLLSGENIFLGLFCSQTQLFFVPHACVFLLKNPSGGQKNRAHSVMFFLPRKQRKIRFFCQSTLCAFSATAAEKKIIDNCSEKL